MRLQPVRPLRFCLLSTFYPPANFGGDGIQVQRLAHALADLGHFVTVAHSLEAYRALTRTTGSREVDQHPRVTVIPIDAGMGLLSPLATHLTGRPLLSRRKLERVVDLDFDVLHFHNPSLLGGPALLGMGRGIKLYTAHEQWLLCPSHTLWQNKRRVCEAPPCWSCTISYGRPPQLWRYTGLVERSLSQIDTLIVPSRTSEALHARFAPFVRIERVAHFVPRPPSTASAVDFLPDRPFFLFVGRLESIKGVATLLRPFRRRRSEDLVIVGSGSLARSLQHEARDLPHVTFLGWRSSSQLDALYRSALAVIVPTLGHEAFGLVAVEAFARGTPAIVRRFGALRELVADGMTGITYESDRELDEALATISDDVELRRALGHRAQEAYEAHWTPKAHLARYFGLIAEIARRRGDVTLATSVEAAIPGDVLCAR